MARLFVLAFVIAALWPHKLEAQTQPHPFADFINVNNILLWTSSNGVIARNPRTDGAGLEFPKGAETYVMFTEGLMWAGYANGELRAGGAAYRAGLQPGKILADGKAANPAHSRYRIYKVRRLTPESHGALSAEVEARLRKDFTEWPTADGAPWVDADANGLYEPDFDDWVQGITATDYPDFQGDEALWWVSNDLDAALTNRLHGTPPIGLEVQHTFWAYDEPGILGNTVFMKHQIINKGAAALTDAYFGKWADPEVGDPFDDFIGVDTLCQVSYAYNGHDYDSSYFDRPPAVGHVLLQGPIVPEAGSYAVFDGAPREGYKNQPISSYAMYHPSDGLYAYPSYGTSHGAQMLYNNMQGRLWNNHEYIDPITADPVRIPFAGNPLTSDGWIDGIVKPPGLRQSFAGTGPFDLAPGDTQEVVYAVVVTQGDDRLHSVELLLQAACELRNEWRSVLPVSVPEIAALPTGVQIAVSPNPAISRVALHYTLDSRDHVRVMVTGILGGKSREVFAGLQPPGAHRLDLPLPPDDFPSGMYFVTLATQRGLTTQTFAIVR